MKPGRLAVVPLAIMLNGATGPVGPKVGDTYEILNDRESTGHGPHGGTNSTSDRDAVVERVVAVRGDGLELEYDLPASTSADDRHRQWQLPARVFLPSSGPPQLLDRPALESRIDAWLKWGGLTRAACGHWVFTWNAFRIDCDPQSVLAIANAFDLRPPDLKDGNIYQDPDAAEPARVIQEAAGPNGATYKAEATVDPARIRRQRAESDDGLGEITRKPVTLDDALRRHEAETIAGTVSAVFDADPQGEVRRRTRTVHITISGGAGGPEDTTIVETIERKRLPNATPAL